MLSRGTPSIVLGLVSASPIAPMLVDVSNQHNIPPFANRFRAKLCGGFTGCPASIVPFSLDGCNNGREMRRDPPTPIWHHLGCSLLSLAALKRDAQFRAAGGV